MGTGPLSGAGQGTQGPCPELPGVWWGVIVLFRLKCLYYCASYVTNPSPSRTAHVTLGHLNNCFSVRLISGCDVVTVLNLPTGEIQQGTFRGRVGARGSPELTFRLFNCTGTL